MNTDINLGYIIFCLKHLYIIKHHLWVFNYEQNIHCTLLGKIQGLSIILFNHSFIFFSIIIATVIQILTSGRERKINITVKNLLTNNCNTIIYPTKKFFQLRWWRKWIYFNQSIIFILFPKYSIWYFHRISYIIHFHILINFKPVIYF